MACDKFKAYNTCQRMVLWNIFEVGCNFVFYKSCKETINYFNDSKVLWKNYKHILRLYLAVNIIFLFKRKLFRHKGSQNILITMGIKGNT